MKKSILLLATFLCLLILYPGMAGAQEQSTESDAAKLAKQTANPIAAMISLPFQFNFNFGIGEYNRTQTVINIMPVLPYKLNSKFNVVNRIILPIINQPDVTQESGSTFGIGDVNLSMFVTPSKAGKVIWGVGPAFNIPTRSSNLLGSPEFGVGPSFIALMMPGNWAIGLTVNNVWSYTNSNLNAMFSQVFVVYTFPSAWFVQMMPTITANWNAEEGSVWSLPLGANAGKVVVIGRQPIKFIAGASYYAMKPEPGPDWMLFAQAVFLFPR